jgi:hypothetical protein
MATAKDRSADHDVSHGEGRTKIVFRRGCTRGETAHLSGNEEGDVSTALTVAHQAWICPLLVMIRRGVVRWRMRRLEDSNSSSWCFFLALVLHGGAACC